MFNCQTLHVSKYFNPPPLKSLSKLTFLFKPKLTKNYLGFIFLLLKTPF